MYRYREEAGTTAAAVVAHCRLLFSSWRGRAVCEAPLPRTFFSGFQKRRRKIIATRDIIEIECLRDNVSNLEFCIPKKIILITGGK